MKKSFVSLLLYELKENYFQYSLYLTLLILVIIQRLMILTNFAFVYMDSDQAVLWQGLQDYSNAKFYEPRFYGQNYSTMMEAFFAVPMFKLGLPVYIALPIVTSILSVFPFVVFSINYFKQKRFHLALFSISILLLLPREYLMITSMPRGFVTGIFISGLSFLFYFFMKSKRKYLLIAFFSMLAYSVNPNSMLLSGALLFFIFLDNIKDKQFYLMTACGLVLGFSVHLISDSFYIKHPNHIVHEMFELEFSLDLFLEHLKFLDKFFNNVTPIMSKSGFFSLVFFLVISIALFFLKYYKGALTVSFILIAILLSLGVNKISDGSATVFFPYSRMYLAVPLLLIFSLSFLDFNFKSKKYSYIWIIIPFFYFIYHIQIHNKEITFNYLKNDVVIVTKVQTILDSCAILNNVAKEHKAELIIFSFHYFQDNYNYGCAPCLESFPNTLRPSFERRTWRLEEDENKIYKNVLILDLKRDFSKEFPFVKAIKNRQALYLLSNNNLPTLDLLDTLKIKYRRFKRADFIKN